MTAHMAVLDQLPDARAVVFETLARTLAPAPRMGVAEWAERFRIVPAESGSRYPGPWRNERAPYLVGVMDALGPDDPAEDVILCKSAQVGGSEVGLNFFGWVVTQDPGPMILVLPSHDEAGKYVRTKLEPAIDATPSLRRRVLEMTNRAERGSTAAFKEFPGGFAQMTFAGTSKGLQMLSARYTIGDELSEWPAESGDRGDPVDQLKTRTRIFERDRKRLWVSTPGTAGACRITAMFEASDKRRFFVPCPHCGAFQVLSFGRLKWDSDVWPHKAWFECAASGCVIRPDDKDAMVAAGVWLATAVDEGEAAPPDAIMPGDMPAWRDRPMRGRQRGFHIWQAYSRFASWDSIVADWKAAQGLPQKLRVFVQQVLGEAWEERGEAPDGDRLLASRSPEWRKGLPPVGPVVFTGAVDVQGNRLEWAVWGWSERMTRWLVDWGVVPGDPNLPETWAAMGRIMAGARYAPGGGREAEVEAWAVDAGYASQAVYSFVRGRPGVFAVDGAKSPVAPMIGSPTKVEVNWRGKRIPKGALLWPVGGFALKGDLYAAIRLAIAGRDETGAAMAGSMILPGDVDAGYCAQLTAEHLVTRHTKAGVPRRVWEKVMGRPNEALDIACYARAMAEHLKLSRLSDADWARIRDERFGTPAQPGLFEAAVVPAAGDAGSRMATTRQRLEAAADPAPRPRGLQHSLLGRHKGR